MTRPLVVDGHTIEAACPDPPAGYVRAASTVGQLDLADAPSVGRGCGGDAVHKRTILPVPCFHRSPFWEEWRKRMPSVLPKNSAALKAIAQELAGQDADYIAEFLRQLLAEFSKSGPDAVLTASPRSARRNARRSGPSRSRASDGPMQRGV